MAPSRGNRLLEAMIMGQKVQMLNPETGELMGVDPAEVSGGSRLPLNNRC